MRQEVLKGGTDSLYLRLMVSGRPVTPASCTVRILDHGVLLESGTATSGAYAPTSATTGEVREDVTVEWSFVVGTGAAQKRVEIFDVVLFKLYGVVTDEDLLREAASLASSDYVHRGSISAEDADGLIDNTLIGDRREWAGSIINMTDGDESGAQYVVTTFDSDTGLLEFTAVSYPSEGDSFLLRRSFQGEIESAWSDVYDKLIQQCSASTLGSRPSLIMTPDRLRRPHLARALEKVFRGISDDQNGVDWARAEYYAKEFEAAWNGMQLVFAENETSDPVQGHETSVQFGFSR